jgi:hypothetical protein
MLGKTEIGNLNKNLIQRKKQIYILKNINYINIHHIYAKFVMHGILV